MYNYFGNFISSFMNAIDVVYKLAMIFIAVFNSGIAIRFFNLNRNRDKTTLEQGRKLDLFKTLTLDHNIKNFYEILGHLESDVEGITLDATDTLSFQEIEKSVESHFINLRRKFYGLFSSIDAELYESIKNKADDLQSKLTEILALLRDSEEVQIEEIDRAMSYLSDFRSDTIKTIYNYEIK